MTIFRIAVICFKGNEEKGGIALYQCRHLQRTFSARETGIMQALEKHNLTRITIMPLLHFSSKFKEISYELSLSSALLILINCLQNSEIPAYTATNIAGSPKNNIYCLINNRTKNFSQNFKLDTFLVKIHQDLNFETKTVGIC